MDDYISREEVLEHYRVTDPAGTFVYCNSILDFVSRLPAADVKPVRWIPVEERMPETDKLVLVVRSDGDMAVAGWNAALGWLHYWSGFRVRNVTHWMPLPELPREEENHDNQR